LRVQGARIGLKTNCKKPKSFRPGINRKISLQIKTRIFETTVWCKNMGATEDEGIFFRCFPGESFTDIFGTLLTDRILNCKLFEKCGYTF